MGAPRASRGQPPPVYHLGLRRGEIPPYVLLPGDPERATRIADSWDSARPLSERREYRSYRGTFGGVELGVVSAGIGGPSLSIVVDELAQLGVHTLVRVGSCGPLLPALKAGGLVISYAAARFERTSEAYAPLGYPAVSDPEVYRALLEAARRRRIPVRSGITATVGTFYPEQGRRGYAGRAAGIPSTPPLPILRRLHLANIEMEMATLFTIAGVFGVRAGGICTVYPDSRGGDPAPADPGPAIDVANEAVRALAEGDGRGTSGRAPR